MTDIMIQKRGSTEVETYRTNPFKLSLAKQKRPISAKAPDLVLSKSEDGEVITEMATFTTYRYVDTEQFVKVFVGGVKATKNLTAAGSKVFQYLLTQLQTTPRRDEIHLTYQKAKLDFIDISAATFTRGLSELRKANLIAPSPIIGVFWINPNYVFNGDRIQYVTQYNRRQKHKAYDHEQLSALPDDDIEHRGGAEDA